MISVVGSASGQQEKLEEALRVKVATLLAPRSLTFAAEVRR
jgi:hypothetical protein